MHSQLLFLHALTPLHAGTGQGVGIIDLPIAREKATGIPFLPGSSLKGALKPRSQSPFKNAVFGQEGDDGTGAVQFADARLLLLPVRSLRGTFAYATSPYLLERFLADLQLTSAAFSTPVPRPAPEEARVASTTLGQRIGNSRFVVLEDLNLKEQESSEAQKWAEWLAPRIFPQDPNAQSRFGARFCVLPDDVFNFLGQTATEVTARIKLQDDTKTVQKGGLWYEESLPTESVLVSVVTATPLPMHRDGGLTPEKVLEVALDPHLRVAQFGGKAGVGRGLCRLAPLATAEARA